MSPHRIGVTDLLRASAETEAENEKKMSRFYGTILVVTHALDLGCAGWFYACEDGTKVSELGEFSLEHSALDAVWLAISRAVLFPTLTAVAVRACRRPTTKLGPARRDESSSRSSSGPTSAGYVAMVDEEAPSILRKGSDRGKTWAKHAAMAILFLASTGCQLYVGVKVNAYEVRSTHKWRAIVLLASAVLWANIEAFASRELAAELTREGALFVPAHPHGLVFDASLAHHWCDLCVTPIRPNQGGFRCKLCDYDICMKCAAKSEATSSENVLRTDAGVATESRLSSAGYLARAVGLARTRAASLASAVLVLGGYSALALAMPAYQGVIIDRVVDRKRRAFITACRAYLVLMVAQGFLRAVYTASFAVVSRTILYELRTSLFRSIMQQDVAFFDGTSSGFLSSRLTNDVQTTLAPIDSSLSSLCYNLIMLVGGVVMCFYTSYSLSLLAFVVVGPIMYLWDAYAKFSKTLTRRVLAAWGEANHVATEALGHVKTVKAFAAESQETRRYEGACGRALTYGIRDALGFGLTSAATSYLDLGTGILILWYGGLLVFQGGSGKSLTVGKLVTFQLYWNMMNSAYQSLQGLVTSFTRAAAAAEKVFSLIDVLPKMDVVAGDSRREAVVAENVRGHVFFEDVTFHYAMRPDKTVLDGVRLDVPAGSTCALVGRSGGGKSTLVALVLRFYDPKSGRILLDGADVRGLEVRSYRRLFGVVQQDTPLMARTIRRNITYGLEDDVADAVPDADVRAAAEKAFALDFITEMADGFETRVGERGGRLSGGQRQRVAVARIFLRRPKLVVLDEATSALDEESQHAVQLSLDALIAQGGSTVFLVAHRLSTVMAADQIVVVDNGRVRERGTHRDLLARKNGVYAALVRRQLFKATAHNSNNNSTPSDDIGTLLDDLQAQLHDDHDDDAPDEAAAPATAQAPSSS